MDKAKYDWAPFPNKYTSAILFQVEFTEVRILFGPLKLGWVLYFTTELFSPQWYAVPGEKKIFNRDRIHNISCSS